MGYGEYRRRVMVLSLSFRVMDLVRRTDIYVQARLISCCMMWMYVSVLLMTSQRGHDVGTRRVSNVSCVVWIQVGS